jgi:AcrR family transcriptional regulator
LSVAKRTRLAPEARRAQLIDVASEQFATKPFGDVAMEEIARQAGVRHGLLYHYFPDKRHLYIEVVRHWSEQIGEAVRTDPNLDPIARIYAGLRAHLDFVERHLVGYLALVTGGNGSDPEVHAINEQARWNGLSHVLRGLDLQEPSPALRVALRGWAGFNEGAIIEWLKRRDLPREQLIDIMAQALLATLNAVDPPAPTR